MNKIFILLLAVLSAQPLWAGTTPKTLVCNFDGENRNKVYTIAYQAGVGTTFRLPDGWQMEDFAVADTANFYGESNGVIGMVRPLHPNKATSVTIYTTNDNLFVFHVTSEPNSHVDELVLVDVHDQRFFKSRVKTEAQQIVRDETRKLEVSFNEKLEAKADEVKAKLLFSLNNSYRIADRKFAVTKVVDDGVFTYVQLGKSQLRPSVYIGETRNPKKLEPVKYTDNGDHYVVHAVLPGNDNRKLYLMLGDDISEIAKN